MCTRSFKNLIIILCVLCATSAYAANKAITSKIKSCNPDTINKFKAEYIKLQNALKYDEKDKEIITKAKEKIDEKNLGKKTEQVLSNNYKNALIKIGKIYQYLNKEPNLTDKDKEVKSNPDVTKFFKAIDPNEFDKEGVFGLNIETLLNTLGNTKVPGIELTPEDKYLLEKLLIHSQDRICTLDKYKNPTSKSKKVDPIRVQYLEQLKKSPLNQMIKSLREMKDTNNLELAKDDITIDQALKDSLNNLHDIIQSHKDCEIKINTGVRIQGCNYDHFITSLKQENFDMFESLLHFINANQQAKKSRTDLNAIELDFKNKLFPICTKTDNGEIFVTNLPFLKDNKIDYSKISCSPPAESKTKNTPSCLKSLNFSIDTERGIKVALKKGSNISTFTIAGSPSCKNLSFDPAVKQAPPETPKTDEQKCLDQNIKDNAPIVLWTKNGDKFECVDLKKDCKDPSKWDNKKGCISPEKSQGEVACDDLRKKEEEKEEDSYLPPGTITWDGKACIDKRKKDETSAEDNEATDDSDLIIDRDPNKKAPPRFQPINIPMRQPFIMPGMP